MQTTSYSTSAGPSERELAAISVGCILLLAFQWLLSRYHFAPTLGEAWATVLWRRVSAFWICGLVAINAVTLSFADSRRTAFLIGFAALLIFAVALSTSNEIDLGTRFFIAARWCGLFALCVMISQARGSEARIRLWTVLCFSVFVPISTAYLGITYAASPETMDFYAYNFDLALGNEIGPFLFVLFHRSSFVEIVASGAYVNVLGAYVLMYALQMRILDIRVVPSLRSFLIAAVSGFVCYFLFPVVGPLNFFAEDYPNHLPAFGDFSISPIPAAFTARNGMPSLHFSWSLLLALNVPGNSRYLRAIFALFCALTVLATLGTGEHYLVDLIAALPFTAAVQALAQSVGHWQLRKRLMWSAARTALVFVCFLVLLAYAPDWLHRSQLAWAIVVVLCVHFWVEITSQRRAVVDNVRINSRNKIFQP